MKYEFEPKQTQAIKEHIKKLNPTKSGRFFYYLIPFRKKVVLKNMRQVFSKILSEQEIIKLSKLFYSHMATSLKENLLLRFTSLEKLKKSAIVLGEEHLWALEGHPVKGVMLITGHFGNWEFAPIAGMASFPQWKYGFYVLRKFISVKWIEKALFKRYYEAGLNVVPKKNALQNVVEYLETNNAVVFIMDQHASYKAKDGIGVDFFGEKAGTFKSPAMIACHTKTPVMGFRSYRREDGMHILEFYPHFKWIEADSPKEEIALNTRQYNAFIEKVILEHPEQWLWMHKRWKNT